MQDPAAWAKFIQDNPQLFAQAFQQFQDQTSLVQKQDPPQDNTIGSSSSSSSELPLVNPSNTEPPPIDPPIPPTTDPEQERGELSTASQTAVDNIQKEPASSNSSSSSNEEEFVLKTGIEGANEDVPAIGDNTRGDKPSSPSANSTTDSSGEPDLGADQRPRNIGASTAVESGHTKDPSDTINRKRPRPISSSSSSSSSGKVVTGDSTKTSKLTARIKKREGGQDDSVEAEEEQIEFDNPKSRAKDSAEASIEKLDLTQDIHGRINQLKRLLETTNWTKGSYNSRIPNSDLKNQTLRSLKKKLSLGNVPNSKFKLEDRHIKPAKKKSSSSSSSSSAQGYVDEGESDEGDQAHPRKRVATQFFRPESNDGVHRTKFPIVGQKYKAHTAEQIGNKVERIEDRLFTAFQLNEHYSRETQNIQEEEEDRNFCNPGRRDCWYCGVQTEFFCNGCNHYTNTDKPISERKIRQVFFVCPPCQTLHVLSIAHGTAVRLVELTMESDPE